MSYGESPEQLENVKGLRRLGTQIDQVQDVLGDAAFVRMTVYAGEKVNPQYEVGVQEGSEDVPLGVGRSVKEALADVGVVRQYQGRQKWQRRVV